MLYHVLYHPSKNVVPIKNFRVMMKLPILKFVYDRKKRAGKNKPGTVDLRITYERKVKYIGTGVRVLPSQWRNGTVVARIDARELNDALDSIMQTCRRVTNTMLEEGCLQLDEIPARMKMEESDGISFLEFAQQRAEVRKYGRSKDSQERYDRFLRYFLQWGGIKFFSDVTDRKILEFDRYLVAKGMKAYSKWNNYHRFLNSFILDAVAEGYLKRNPYKWLNIEKDKNSHGLEKYLTEDEVMKIRTAAMPTGSLEHVRDVFVFQIYTCLAYKDLAAFDAAKMQKVDGELMYKGERGKTGKEFEFILLGPAKEVLDKYHGVLPIISNVKYNQYLKVVAQAAGVDHPITTHWARHTGATILLNRGVDMETVAKILGHSTPKITRSTYAKLLDKTVVERMKKLDLDL